METTKASTTHKSTINELIYKTRTWYSANKDFIKRHAKIGALVGFAVSVGYSLGKKTHTGAITKVVESPVTNGAYAVFFTKEGVPTVAAELSSVQSVDSPDIFM
jgi:hypothetical protein